MSDGRAVLSVSDVTEAIDAAIASALPGTVWVRGETSSVRERRGNTYFDLIETDAHGGTVAKLPVHVLRWQRRDFDRDLAEAGMTLDGGVDVLVCGQVSYWAAGGQLRFEAVRIDPTYTLGAIAARRREVLDRIAAEGLTRHNARHPIPTAPLRVGVVAAGGSEAAADIRRQFDASGYAFTLVTADARVQGARAAESLAEALGQLGDVDAHAGLDVVIVARGGGSEHDLSAFDDERVVRAIVAAPFPVWTGVGHEQNQVAADVVAHTAWPTPTAAARGVVDRVAAADQRIVAAAQVLAAAPAERLARAGDRVEGAARWLGSGPARRLAEVARRFDGASRGLVRGAAHSLRSRDDAVGVLCARLASEAAASVGRRDARIDGAVRVLTGPAPIRPVERGASDLRHAGAELVSGARLWLASSQRRVDVGEATLRAADPQRVLERGFVHLRDQRGATIPRRRDLPAGEPVTAGFADGTAVLHSEPDPQERSPR